MNETNILLTGATGFIGSALLGALQRDPRIRVRALVRRTPGEEAGRGRTTYVHGDLTDPSSLPEVCRGIHTVIHAASYVGPDPRQCQAVNTDGTAALVEAARRQGIRRLIYVSTASVYGRGRHDGAGPPPATYDPASAASRSRLAAERFVRESGGWVVRPHLVYGNGDRWFIPALAELLTERRALLDHPARVSTVMVHDLARAVCGLVTLEEGRLSPGAALDVNHPAPTSVTTLAGTVAQALGLDLPDHSLSFETFGQRLPEGHLRRNLTMFAHDRWYASRAVWDLVGHEPGDPFATGFARYASWYRWFLRRQENAGV